MLTNTNLKFEIKFSIPGRIRLHVEYLKSNLIYAQNIENSLSALLPVKVNAKPKTGTLLILYDTEKVNEFSLLNSLKQVCIQRSNSNNIRVNKTQNSSSEFFKEENSLKKRLSIISIFTASLLYTTASPKYAFSVLVFGMPFIIDVLLKSSLKYTLLRAKQNKVYIDDIKTIREIQRLKSILLEPNIIFNDATINKLNAKSYVEIEHMIANGIVEDPINKDARKLVKDLRQIGMIDLSMIELNDNKNVGKFVYAKKSLGLVDETIIVSSKLIIFGNRLTKSENNHSILLLCKINNNSLLHEITNEGNIHIYCDELSKIPWLINICKKSDSYLTRALVTAVSINVFGLMLAFTGYVNLSASLLLYFINMLGNILYLKHSILDFNKEIPNGEQREFSYA